MKSMYCKLPSGANFRAKVRDNSTIRTVREELSKQIKIPESYINLNISHRLRNLQNPTPIRSLGINPSDNIDVSFIPPRLSFQYGKTAPFSLPFQINSTITTAKKMLAPRFHVAPETIKLFLYNVELSEKQLLRDLRIPINRHIQIVIEKPKSKSALLFMMQHEAYRLEFPDETTVAQIKDELMRHADKATISIKLLYNGLYLDDNSVLKDLNINPKQCIIVESEMLEREDFILENNSFDDDENIESLLDNSTHASRARTAIIKRRREMRQLSKQCNSNLASSQKVPIVQPEFSRTAPNTQRIRKSGKSNSKNLSKTLSGSLKGSQEESEIEEEEEVEPLTESQSLGKFTENQSNEKLTQNQSFDQPNVEKFGSGQNIPNLVDSVSKLTGNNSSQLIEEEEEPDDGNNLNGLVGSLQKIAKSGSNNSAVVSREIPATLEDSIHVEDEEAEGGKPTTLEDSVPVENEAAGQPATLEDSIPVDGEEAEGNEPVTLEDSIPVDDGEAAEGGQPVTLEDSIPVDTVEQEEEGQPVTLEDSVSVEDESAGQPATLEDSIPVESKKSGNNLPDILSGAAGNLMKSGSDGKVEDFNEDEAGQPTTLEESAPVEDEASGQPATLEDSVSVEDEAAGQPATLEDSIPVDGDEEAEANEPVTLEDSIPVDDEAAEANEPVTLEDSIPVDGGEAAEGGQPATLEDSVPVDTVEQEEEGQPVTLEDSIPVESKKSGNNLPDILSGAAGNLMKSGSDGKVEDFNDADAVQDESSEQQQKVVDFNEDSEENGQAVVTREIRSNEQEEAEANEPATLEETASSEGGGLSNLLSGVASGLSNNVGGENEDEAANEPATLEDSTPVNDEQNQDEAEANEPATLEETAPSEGGGLSNLLSGVASGLSNNVGGENEDEAANEPATLEDSTPVGDDQNQDEANEPATLEDSTPVGDDQNQDEANEPATLEETAPSEGGGLSSLLSGVASGLSNNVDDTQKEEPDSAVETREIDVNSEKEETEEASKPLELAEADEGNNEQNEESSGQDGPDLTRIISSNASALTGNNNQEDGEDQADSKSPLDLTGMVNNLL